jgi:cyanate permease
MIYDATGSFAPLWLTLAGCAGLVAIAGMFLPGRLLRMGSVPVTQPAE